MSRVDFHLKKYQVQWLGKIQETTGLSRAGICKQALDEFIKKWKSESLEAEKKEFEKLKLDFEKKTWDQIDEAERRNLLGYEKSIV